VLYNDTERGANEMAGAGLMKATPAAAKAVPRTRRRVSKDDARNGSPP
jgi:hypothetical protein